jgi:hypothetical protein
VRGRRAEQNKGRRNNTQQTHFQFSFISEVCTLSWRTGGVEIAANSTSQRRGRCSQWIIKGEPLVG